MAGSTFEHFHADACVGPRVSDRPHVQTGQDPIGIAAGPNVKSDRMTFCMHPETFNAAQGALDGVAEQPRSECSMALVAHVFFATECSTI